MKILFLTILIILVRLGSCIAQDLIITPKGDSLNCKITRVKSDYIYFTFKHENEIRNTLLHVKQVKFYQKNFFTTAEVPLQKVKDFEGNYQKLRLGVFGGLSYMTAKVSDNVPADFRDYVKELKSGYNIGGEAAYFFSENLGLGINYSLFKTKNEANSVYNTGTGQAGKIKDDITIHYIGPALCTRLISGNKKAHYFSNISLGYLDYQNQSIALIESFTLTSGTLGMWWGFGSDFTLHKKLSLGLNLNFILGTLNQYNYTGGGQTRTITLDKENLESISRIDLSTGLKWSF